MPKCSFDFGFLASHHENEPTVPYCTLIDRHTGAAQAASMPKGVPEHLVSHKTFTGEGGWAGWVGWAVSC